MIIANLDKPDSDSIHSGPITVWGWAFSDKGVISNGFIETQGKRLPLQLGVSRPDVLVAHGDKCRNAFVGFHTDIEPQRLPCSSSGQLEIILKFEDSSGETLEIRKSVSRGEPSGEEDLEGLHYGLDLPAGGSLSQTLAIEGWVISSETPITRVEVETNGETFELSTGWERPDVTEYHSIGIEHRFCGFRGFLIPKVTGELTYELKFYSDEKLVRSAPHSVIVREMDSIFPDSCSQPTEIFKGAEKLYADLLISTLNGSIYSDKIERSDGRDWPVNAHTMLGMRRLSHLRACVETAIHEGILGDFIETGVWKGGSCILMKGLLRAADDRTRTVWVADSFQGLPKPEVSEHPLDEGDSLFEHSELAIPVEQVKANFRRYGLLDDRVKFLPGWFCDTLPSAPIERLAILRLDGDMYESTIDALNSLYHKLQPGGFCIVDDYGCIPACRAAVHDFRAINNISDPIHPIDWTGAFWRKSCNTEPS